MIPLLLVATLVATVAALLLVRAHAGNPHAAWTHDRRAGRSLAVAAAVLAVGAPIPLVQQLAGVAVPARCQAKPAEGGAVPSDTALLRAEARERLTSGIPPVVELRDVTRVERLTGPASPNRTHRRWDVFGTDLGHPFRHNGQLGLLFGDTFATEARTGWRSNILAWTDDGPADGLRLTRMHGRAPRAHEILGSVKLVGWEQTVIPTNAVSVGDRIVVHYMSVKCWGVPGDWVVNHSGLAVSTDGGRRWRQLNVRWSGEGPFTQLAFVRDGRHLYAFGIPAGRHGAVHLARVPVGRVTDAGAWRYRGAGGWQDDPARAEPIVPGPAGELSVQWLPRHDTWIMLYLDESRRGVVMRTADDLVGPWSAEDLVLSEATVPSLYAPYLVPTSAPGHVYFTLSRYDTYNVQLMRAQLFPGDQPHPGLVSAEPD